MKTNSFFKGTVWIFFFITASPVLSSCDKQETLLDTNEPNEYFIEEANNTITKIKGVLKGDGLVFVLIADNHLSLDNDGRRWTEDTFKNLKYLHNNYYFDGIIHLGDIISPSEWGSGARTDYEAKKLMQDYFYRLSQINKDVFAIPGNHDGKDFQSFSSEWWNDMEHINENRRICRGDTHHYYYVDYEIIQTRCVFLATFDDVDGNNTYGFSTHEICWFVDVLRNTPAGYKLILFAHSAPYCASYVTTYYSGVTEKGVTSNRELFYGICNSYNNHTVFYGSSYDGTAIECDFRNVSGKIVAYISGHIHGDSVRKPGETFTGTAKYNDEIIPGWHYVNGMPCPVITIASANPSIGNGENTNDGAVSPRKIDKSKNQECWDVMVFVPEDKQIHFIRFGAGEDRVVLLN